MMTGTPCSGPTKPVLLNAASRRSASCNAVGLSEMMALIVGPFLSYAPIRSRYICTNCRAVRMPARYGAGLLAVVASTISKDCATSAWADGIGAAPVVEGHLAGLQAACHAAFLSRCRTPTA